MGKKGLADKVRAKRKEKRKPAPNPFEVKVNKVKHVVVNKKVQSWEKGLPGVSRSKAVKKRKDTLLRELHHSKKSNSLLDKRFGEGDDTMTADEKMVQRFAIERKKMMKSDEFNVDDNEEILTHYGQSLAENLQDTVGSDSDNDDEQAIKNITGDLQFGGLSKNESNLSWKDKMKDIIADSKKQKYERQVEKEKIFHTTNELDNVWKSVGTGLNKLSNQPRPVTKASSYMQLFQTLIKEQKSVGASDKLKTDEEKAKEEAEKLQVLEAQRLSRMMGDSDKPSSNHVSADDLNDGFSFEPKKNTVSFANDSDDDDQEKESEVANADKVTDTDEETDESDEEDGDDDDEDEDGEDDSSENFSDLASDDEEEEGESKDTGDKQKKVSQGKSILKNAQAGPRKNQSKEVNLDLPYVFSAPGSYDELTSLLHGHSAEEQALILSRLRKCHHPSLAEGNKGKLEKIHQYLLHYFNELVSSTTIDTALVNHVIGHIWELSQMFPSTAAEHLQKFIIDTQKLYVDRQQDGSGRATFVGVNVLLHLSLIGGLFPTSDYRHPVTTPTISFVAQMLSECGVRTMRDCVTGIYLCSFALEFVRLSKRYIPEVLTFLHGLLVLGVDENESSDVKIYPPLKNSSQRLNILQVKEKCELSSEWSLTEIFSKDQSELNTDKYRCEAVSRCIDLLLQGLNLWADLPDLAAVSRPLKAPLSMLPVQNYPDSLTKSIQGLKSKMREGEAKKLQAMQLPAKRPEPLRLFEPKVEEFWSGKKKKGGPNKEANERQRLTHKLKRETKAAIREIKRDNEVLATHKLEVTAKKDAERKRKTKELMSSLANQEGDYKAIKRGKHT